MKSSKSNGVKKKKIVMVSGGFDPVHIGHVRLFQSAKKLGDELVVVVNNDKWKMKKRGHVFMHDKERKEIIEAFACVDRVIITNHSNMAKNAKDMSVSRELHKIKPHIFANGGDRDEANAKDPNSSLFWDLLACKKLGIKMVYNVGLGGKIQSSSELVKKVQKKKK